MEEVQAVLLCKSFLGSWVVLAPRRCTSIESEAAVVAAVVAVAAGYSLVEEGWKKPPPPNRVNTGSHFAINFFRLVRAALLRAAHHAAPLPQPPPQSHHRHGQRCRHTAKHGFTDQHTVKKFGHALEKGSQGAAWPPPRYSMPGGTRG